MANYVHCDNPGCTSVTRCEGLRGLYGMTDRNAGWFRLHHESEGWQDYCSAACLALANPPEVLPAKEAR